MCVCVFALKTFITHTQALNRHSASLSLSLALALTLSYLSVVGFVLVYHIQVRFAQRARECTRPCIVQINLKVSDCIKRVAKRRATGTTTTTAHQQQLWSYRPFPCRCMRILYNTPTSTVSRKMEMLERMVSTQRTDLRYIRRSCSLLGVECMAAEWARVHEANTHTH